MHCQTPTQNKVADSRNEAVSNGSRRGRFVSDIRIILAMPHPAARASGMTHANILQK